MKRVRAAIGWWRAQHHAPCRCDCPGCDRHAQMMRRGPADCHIPEHADALRRYGHAIWEAQEWEARARRAEAALDELRAEAAKWRNVLYGDNWDRAA